MSKAVPRSVVILIAVTAWTGAFTHGARSARVAPAVTNLGACRSMANRTRKKGAVSIAAPSNIERTRRTCRPMVCSGSDELELSNAPINTNPPAGVKRRRNQTANFRVRR